MTMTTTNDPFHDDDIAALRTGAGAMLLPSGRRLVLPEAFGFCRGVRHAVRLLQETVDQTAGRQVWLLGAMIHNEAVNAHFAGRGARIIEEHDLESLFTLASHDDVFVIPAFGLPLDFDRRLRSYVTPPGLIVDTTCPFVRRVWQAVAKATAAGNAVIIHGKPGHQETAALWSRATAAAAVAILPNPGRARQFAAASGLRDLLDTYPSELLLHPEHLAETPWTLVNQTTMLCTETTAIAGLLQAAAWHQAPLQVADTLCEATHSRQAAAQALCCQPCDLFLVLGGANSSNTIQLYRLAAMHATAFFLQSPDDLEPDLVRHFDPETSTRLETRDWLKPSCRTVGILAGASCPDSELGLLVRKMRRLA